MEKTIFLKNLRKVKTKKGTKIVEQVFNNETKYYPKYAELGQTLRACAEEEEAKRKIPNSRFEGKAKLARFINRCIMTDQDINELCREEGLSNDVRYEVEK